MKSIVRFILSVSCVALLIHGCDKQANESSSPVLRLTADEEITVPAEGGNFSIGYTGLAGSTARPREQCLSMCLKMLETNPAWR